MEIEVINVELIESDLIVATVAIVDFGFIDIECRMSDPEPWTFKFRPHKDFVTAVQASIVPHLQDLVKRAKGETSP